MLALEFILCNGKMIPDDTFQTTFHVAFSVTTFSDIFLIPKRVLKQ